jgi:phosphatidate cytidylyltransferase
MRQRLISAAVLVPVVVIVFLLGQPWLTLAIAVLAAAAALEAGRLLRAAGSAVTTALAVGFPTLATLGLVASFSMDGGPLLVVSVLALWVIACALPALARQDPGDGLRLWQGTLLAGSYGALLAAAAAIVALPAPGADIALLGMRVDTGRALLLVLVLTVWSLDSVAYLAGRFYGRGHFFNHISPNKTWTGSIAGTIAAIVVCALLMSMMDVPLLGGALLGAVIAVAAQSGDLAESMLKRAARAKDSGTLIPGHGGILDRVDSFLFAAPATFAALLLARALFATPWS